MPTHMEHLQFKKIPYIITVMDVMQGITQWGNVHHESYAASNDQYLLWGSYDLSSDLDSLPFLFFSSSDFSYSRSYKN